MSVTLDWDVISGVAGTAMLEGGQLLTPGATRRLLCDATVIPAVLGGASEVLDLGRSARTVNTAIRRAITIRDQGCIWAGCDRPPTWCDAHHVDFVRREALMVPIGGGRPPTLGRHSDSVKLRAA